jgi:hypothetical protein
MRIMLGDLADGDALLSMAERQIRAEPGPPIEIIPTLIAEGLSAHNRGDYAAGSRILGDAVNLLTAKPAPYFSKDQIELELAADDALQGKAESMARMKRVENAVRMAAVTAGERVRCDLLAGIVQARFGARERSEELYRSAFSLAEKETPLQFADRVELKLRLAQLLAGEGRGTEAAAEARLGLGVAQSAYGAFADRHPFVVALREIR